MEILVASIAAEIIGYIKFNYQMKKKLINNRFYFISLFAVMVVTILVFALMFFTNETSQSESTLNYQVDFVSVRDEHKVIDYYSANENLSNNKIESNKKIENDKVENDKKIENDDYELKIQNLQTYISGFSSDLLMAADLQEKFDADEIDAVAATDAEKDLAYVFYQGMEWQEFSPQDISCKANMCRVKLTISGEQENNKLMELISNEMNLNNINYSFALPVNLPAEGIDYIYFVKGSLSGVLPGNN